MPKDIRKRIETGESPRVEVEPKLHTEPPHQKKSSLPELPVSDTGATGVMKIIIEPEESSTLGESDNSSS